MDNNNKKDKENYNAVLDDLGALGDGITGVVDDGVSVVADGASQVVSATSFNRFGHRCSYPRHDHLFLSLSLYIYMLFLRSKCE